MADRVGQQFGNYRLVALLGQGGFAEVYLGQHVRLNLQAAIKVLHTYLTEQEVAHFQQEAETIATLMHPAIVRILDYDVWDGIPFLVMDYAPGGSLRRRYPRGTVVPLPQILSSVKQVAAGLQYAHERKFIHRDVKPENMLLGRQEEMLLSDFGLAALAHSSGSLSTQEAIGTLAYMAPEQIEGHPRATSDQYALGVVVYEWLCGSRPFEGSATEVMVQQLSVLPPPLHEKVATIPLGIEQVVLRALAKDPKARFASVHDFAAALELANPQPALSPETPDYATVAVAPDQPVRPPQMTLSAELLAGALAPTVYPGATPPTNLGTPASQAADETPLPGQLLAPTAAVLPHPLEPTTPVKHRSRRLPRSSAALLIGLVGLVVVGGVLGSLSLLTHFGVFGTHTGLPAPGVVRGGTWTVEVGVEPDSFFPNKGTNAWYDLALYLPLFYADAQGTLHPGAASEVPTLQNGDISADARTWTFHMRPGLVWSDGQPYDARDVDFSWRLWLNPRFGANGTQGFNLIKSADVSADHLSITFHLTQAYAPFLSLWVDGWQAPLPSHHFSRLTPEAILKEILNPRVTSGPFLLGEYAPADHVTLVPNPRYYRAREGLPYLDKVRVHITDVDPLQDLQAGTITSVPGLNVSEAPAYERLSGYTLVASPTSAGFEAMYFNFHNVVLANHLEVRQAMAMAIDRQALVKGPLHGFAEPICTDHGSFYHPGYEVTPPCTPFDLVAANKLLDDNGWAKGADGVRTRDGQRLEFEYSTNVTGAPWRTDIEAMLQRSFRAIGIRLDIQNYSSDQMFGHLVPEGKASPPSGAVAGRYDIAEVGNNFNYDPDDSSIQSCDQPPFPVGGNSDFYCNPELEVLYKQEVATADPGVRQQLFDQIHGIYLAVLPFITLFGQQVLSIVRKGTHNYQVSPLSADTVNIAERWCDNGKC